MKVNEDQVRDIGLEVDNYGRRARTIKTSRPQDTRVVSLIDVRDLQAQEAGTCSIAASEYTFSCPQSSEDGSRHRQNRQNDSRNEGCSRYCFGITT